MQTQVDARLKGVIKFLAAVCGKEEDALVIFNRAEEDGYEGMSAWVRLARKTSASSRRRIAS